MNLKCKINGVEYENLVQGFNISEEYNETLDSASIILSNVRKMDLRPYDDVYIYEGEFTGYGKGYELPSFFLHFLVDQFTEEMINPSENADDIRYKYKIDLMSETKKLETIQLPNFSITQPLDIAKKKTVYQYIVDVVDLYNPLYKVGKDKVWTYKKKYEIDKKLEDVFGKVYSPDFSLNNPNLRDVLTQLMLTKDMIPVVKNDVITAIDISKRNGVFNVDTRYITSIVGSRSSDNHCDSLRRTYSNALSQDNTCRMVEYLGFRNSESGMLTLENLRLETRYPIYKVNKVYMCYYKKVKVVDELGNTKDEKIFLCKQDISKLVKLNSERNLLSEDWVDFNENVDTGITVDELSKYKIATVGYDIGSNYITGWGVKYNYIKNKIFNTEAVKTYIENVLEIMDLKYPYGIYNYGYITSNTTILDGNAISGTKGSLESRVVNVFENNNLALFMKSLFFEIDYNAFYSGTIVHSKDVDRDDIVINDNSSSSLTLLEQDGVLQKEKVNRFGNKAIQINATYDDFSQLQPLGSVYNYGGDTDVIIYHREISVNNNLINCVYYGTKDYVLKNYFTSVYARHRPFNLMSYGESVRRSENKKMYVMLSKDNYYYENENKIMKIDKTFIEKFLSFFKETTLGISKGNFIFNDKINYGYYTYENSKYASDVNAFVSGSSMCFNIAMYDNVSGGVYLDKDKKEPYMENVDDDYIRGSIQKWYITSDEETGFAETMGFYIGHIDSDNMFFEKDVLDIDEEFWVKDVIENKIMALPKIYIEEEEMTNVIGNEFKLNKDNKELVDMTYQFELVSDSDDILFSPWALRLSELLGNYLKFANDKTAEDFSNDEVSFGIITATAINYYSTDVEGRPFGMNYCPIMVLEFSNYDLTNIKEGPFTAVFEFKKDRGIEDGFSKDIIYYRFIAKEIISYDETEGIIELKGEQKLIFDGGFLSLKTTEDITPDVVITLKKVNIIGNTDVPEGYTWFSNCSVSFTTVNAGILSHPAFDIRYFGTNYSITYNDGNNFIYLDDMKNKGHLFKAGIEKSYSPQDPFDESTFDRKEGFFIGDDYETTLYYKNFFVTTSLEKMKKEIVYDELEKLNSSITFRPNEVFFVGDNPNENGGYVLAIDTEKLKIKTSVGNLPVIRIAKSVQVWYKDELSYENDTEGLITTGEKGYHFVFGVNLDDFIQSERYIYIYISLLSKKDRRVFDEGHNLVGYIRNEAKSTELISSQNYDEIE